MLKNKKNRSCCKIQFCNSPIKGLKKGARVWGNGKEPILKKFFSSSPRPLLLSSRKFAGGAELAVVDHQEEVSGNHHQIENIQSQHPIDFAEHFVADTGDVADDDQPQKADTFADGILDFESFPDGNRPAGTETNKHDSFVKSHK